MKNFFFKFGDLAERALLSQKLEHAIWMILAFAVGYFGVTVFLNY